MKVIRDNYNQLKSTNGFLIVKFFVFSDDSEIFSAAHLNTQNNTVQKSKHSNQKTYNSRLNQISQHI
jgi:hypothetical protein